MFTFSTQKIVSVPQGCVCNSHDILEAVEGLNNAYAELTESQRGMDEVCQIMSNVQQSLEALSQFGDKAIAPLNIDKSLENLLGIEEKMITVEKATEGLSEAAKTAWEKFKEWVKIIIAKLSEFAAKIVEWIKNIISSTGEKCVEIKESLDKMTETAFVSAAKTLHVSKETATEALDVGLYFEKARVVSPEKFERFVAGVQNLISTLTDHAMGVMTIVKNVETVVTSDDESEIDKMTAAVSESDDPEIVAANEKYKKFVDSFSDEHADDKTWFELGYTSRDRAYDILKSRSKYTEAVKTLEKMCPEIMDETKKSFDGLLEKVSDDDALRDKKKTLISKTFALLRSIETGWYTISSNSGKILSKQIDGLLWFVRNVPKNI